MIFFEGVKLKYDFSVADTCVIFYQVVKSYLCINMATSSYSNTQDVLIIIIPHIDGIFPPFE